MSDTKNDTILVIDDDPRNIFALKATLKTRNYRCITAPDAATGLKLMATDPSVGIVLMDMMMPEMDGYETLRHIRSDEQLRHMPVIAVTAQAMRGDKERALEAGANAYISKPINVDLLLDLLKQYIQ